jgi:hypothetical protein
MTRLRSLVHIGLTGSRWLLPWISILLVSAAMTFAMNGALTGSWATPYWWPAVAIASPPSEGRAADTVAYEQAVRENHHHQTRGDLFAMRRLIWRQVTSCCYGCRRGSRCQPFRLLSRSRSPPRARVHHWQTLRPFAGLRAARTTPTPIRFVERSAGPGDALFGRSY